MSKPTILLVFGLAATARNSFKEYVNERDSIIKANAATLLIECPTHRVRWAVVAKREDAFKHSGMVYSDIFFDESFYQISHDYQDSKEYLLTRIRYLYE